MADTLSKFFEVRWKTVEKESTTSNSAVSDKEIAKQPLAKKRKMNHDDSFLEEPAAKRVMAYEDRMKLGRYLGSLTELPPHIISFMRDHNSYKESECGDDDDEEIIEIDIHELSHDVLFQLRNLLDEFLHENQKKKKKKKKGLNSLKLLHGQERGNSLKQQCDGSEMGSCISSVRIGKFIETTILLSSPKLIHRPESMDWETSPRRKPSVNGLDQLEDAKEEKLTPVEKAYCHQDGNNSLKETQRHYRAALLKQRFADIISKAAREKLINVKLEPEKKALELRKRKEKARLQAEVEEARRRVEAEAEREAKRKLKHEREAARQAMLEIVKSVEINEDSTRSLKELELVETVNKKEQLTYIREDGLLGVLWLGGSYLLEQFGLFFKHNDDEDEDEDEGDLLAFPDNIGYEVEEGEIV